MGDYDGDDGGGLRRQLEEALNELKTLKESHPAEIEEAEKRGREAGATQAQRRFDATGVLGDLGYPGLASVFVEKHPDGDPKELAPQFLTELGLKPVERQQAAPPAPQPVAGEVQEAVQAFQQSVQTVNTSTETFDREQYLAMAKDPARRAEAQKAYAEGRVKGLKVQEDPRIYQMSDGAGAFKPKAPA